MGTIISIADSEGKILLCFSAENFAIRGRLIKFWGSGKKGGWTAAPGDNIYILSSQEGTWIK